MEAGVGAAQAGASAAGARKTEVGAADPDACALETETSRGHHHEHEESGLAPLRLQVGLAQNKTKEGNNQSSPKGNRTVKTQTRRRTRRTISWPA